MTEFQQIRAHVLGIGSRPAVKHPAPAEILKRNWFPKAIKLAQNRMILGPFRYGYFKEDKGNYDRISSIETRWHMFKKDKNLEHLLDIINLCGMEFEDSSLPGTHFSTLDDVVHTKKA